MSPRGCPSATWSFVNSDKGVLLRCLMGLCRKLRLFSFFNCDARIKGEMTEPFSSRSCCASNANTVLLSILELLFSHRLVGSKGDGTNDLVDGRFERSVGRSKG